MRPATRWDRGLAVTLFAAAAVRIAWCIVAARTPQAFGDPFAYLHHADDIASGRGYVTFFTARPTAYYPVGYPALLGGGLWVARLASGAATALQASVVLNVVSGVATVWLTYALTERIADRRTARLAAWLVALFPGLVLYSATAHLETAFTALVMLCAWLACGSRDLIPPRRRLVLLGLAVGVTLLVRPIVLPFVVVLAVGWRRAGWKRSIGASAVVILVAALVILPWSIRSTRSMHGFVAVATNTGDNLCIGHSSFSNGGYLDLGTYCWPGYDD